MVAQISDDTLTNCFFRQLGPTPLVPVDLGHSSLPIWCKLEFLNPSGSTKDRIARYILEKAWRQGKISHGDLVVEASSGSTSIALALTCAQMGLRFTAVMPSSVSNERVLMIRAFGGQIELVDKALGMKGALDRATELATTNGGFLPMQFENQDNAEAHRIGTAREILGQVPSGTVNRVVSGIGTGGTLLGLYQGFAQAGCDVKPVAARPVSTTGDHFHIECCSFSARIPGVLDGFSKLYDPEKMPGLTVIEVEDRLAISITRQLIKLGFPVGPSSGLNYAAAVKAAAQLDTGATVVTVFPDRMERYFSTELFGDLK